MSVILRESVEGLVNSTESFEKHQKQKEYYEYITNHIANVNTVFERDIIPLMELSNISSEIPDHLLKHGIEVCAKHIKDHDASKFGDEEFDGYREKYYPTSIEIANPDFQELASEKVEEAWIHHYTHNPHHPKYWVSKHSTMSLDYIIEMICDWMSFHVNEEDGWTKCREWYKSDDAWEEREDLGEVVCKVVDEILFNIIKLA